MTMKTDVGGGGMGVIRCPNILRELGDASPRPKDLIMHEQGRICG